MKSLVLAGLLGLACGAQGRAQKVVLVELFTSEGCSSCPPADTLLRQIDQKHSKGGQLIIGLSEHVTYWNQLGWADPFSQQMFTDRQNAYGDRFQLSSVYTPQMVVNGTAQMNGGDGAAVERAVSAQGAETGIKLKIVDTRMVEGQLQVTFLAEAVPHGPKGSIYAVIADDMASSQVLRGENGGHRLTHVSVARSLVKVAALESTGTPTARAQVVMVSLPPVIAGQEKTGRHLVLFVQQGDAGKVLAVDSKGI